MVSSCLVPSPRVIKTEKYCLPCKIICTWFSSSSVGGQTPSKDHYYFASSQFIEKFEKLISFTTISLPNKGQNFGNISCFVDFYSSFCPMYSYGLSFFCWSLLCQHDVCYIENPTINFFKRIYLSKVHCQKLFLKHHLMSLSLLTKYPEMVTDDLLVKIANVAFFQQYRMNLYNKLKSLLYISTPFKFTFKNKSRYLL